MQSSGQSVLTESFLCLQIRPCLCPVTYLCMHFFCSLYDHMILNKKRFSWRKETDENTANTKGSRFLIKAPCSELYFYFSEYIILHPGVHFFFHWVLSMYLHITAEYKRPALSTPNEFIHHWSTYFRTLWALWLSIPSSVAIWISVCGWLSNKTFLLWSLDCGALSLGALLISWLIPPPC